MVDGALLAAVVLVAAAGLSAALVPLSLTLARRCGVLDEPNHRKIHSVPTPRLGGVAVFAAFTSVALGGYFLSPFLRELPWERAWLGEGLTLLQDASNVQTKLLALVIGSALAFGVGLLDDVFGSRFPVWLKAAGQVLAAVVLIAADVRTSFLPYPWMNTVVTLLWLVGITNAFNLLDNMDGLAAGVAFVASAILLMNAWSLGEYLIGLILAAFMGSLLGFLFFNYQPASVFLGDCGSLFIGFLMAALTLLERYLSHASSTLFPILMPVVVLAVPLVDTVTVVVIRLREGRPIYVGDRHHLSHRLVALGLSRRGAVLFLYLATFCLGLGAASLTSATVWQSALVLLQTTGFVALLLILMFLDRQPPGGQA